MNYTADDIIFNRNTGRQDIRRWNAGTGQYGYKEKSFHTFATTDGKFITKQDIDGYSYWYRVEDDCKMGDVAYDYLFATDDGDKLYAAAKLNKVLERLTSGS